MTVHHAIHCCTKTQTDSLRIARLSIMDCTLRRPQKFSEGGGEGKPLRSHQHGEKVAKIVSLIKKKIAKRPPDGRNSPTIVRKIKQKKVSTKKKNSKKAPI